VEIRRTGNKRGKRISVHHTYRERRVPQKGGVSSLRIRGGREMKKKWVKRRERWSRKPESYYFSLREALKNQKETLAK